MTRTLSKLFFILFYSSAISHSQDVKLIQEVSVTAHPELKKLIHIKNYRLYQIDYQHVQQVLNNDRTSSLTLELPTPDGTLHTFQLHHNNTLNPELAQKFPAIKTFDAYNVSNPNEQAKIDITPHGFHAMILSIQQDPVYIDPVSSGGNYYVTYYKKDTRSKNNFKCDVLSNQKPNINRISIPSQFANFHSCELRTYRLAVAATAQYTQYHGGTVALALAAEATTINRVNGIYEQDLGIHFELIANNNLLIYTNPNNQPYTSGQPNLEIDQNQTNIDTVIGPSNYDIGHLFDASGSGLAAAGVCENGVKAMGVTGNAPPVGDAFDVDYVAHEMGHQFGASHTQNNSCNRYNPTAVEPGSGSTIMGYAGICPPNVQAHSGAYFHGVSLEEMGAFVSNPNHNCPVKTPIAPAPVIHSASPHIVIPANTPFILSASAHPNDPNQTVLYNWEQMDNEVSTQPPNPYATGGPNFRSFNPSIDSSRYLPQLQALDNNGPYTWEVLPKVTRDLNFRVTARATPGAACNSFQDMSLSVDTHAGPFIIKYPNIPNVKWQGNTIQTITWNPAQTNSGRINAQQVDILLSTDGGLSFPNLLASHVANNGAKDLCVPNQNITNGRIMIRASNGTFFNVTHYNLNLMAAAPTPPQLGQTLRNPMKNTEARIQLINCITALNETYAVNGLIGATVYLDHDSNQFIIEHITKPNKTVVTITATDSLGVSRTSNAVTIPSIL